MKLRPVERWTSTEIGRETARKWAERPETAQILSDCLLEISQRHAYDENGAAYIAGAFEIVRMALSLSDPQIEPKAPNFNLPNKE